MARPGRPQARYSHEKRPQRAERREPPQRNPGAGRLLNLSPWGRPRDTSSECSAMAKHSEPGSQNNPSGLPQEGHGGQNATSASPKQGKKGNGAQKRQQKKKS